MDSWMIYWWTRFDSISAAFTVIAILGGIFIGVVAVIGGISKSLGCGFGEDDEDNRRAKGCFKIIPKFLWLVIPCWIISVFVPSSKEFAMMVVIPKIANSELSAQVQKDIPELYKIAVDALKEKISPKNKS